MFWENITNKQYVEWPNEVSTLTLESQIDEFGEGDRQVIQKSKLHVELLKNVILLKKIDDGGI